MSKKVLISGAAGGLGIAVTQSFLEASYRVTALTNPNETDEVDHLKEATGNPENLIIEAVNAFDAEEVRSFVQQQYDPKSIHALILLIGGFAMGSIEKTDEAQLDKMIRLNFKTAYYFIQACLPLMADHSRIILIGARPALQPSAAKDMIAYSISKGMVLQLADIINEEGKERNVQAVTVLPSIIDTPANRKAMPDEDFEKWVKPREIAEAMLYACSDAGLKQSGAQFKMYGQA